MNTKQNILEAIGKEHPRVNFEIISTFNRADQKVKFEKIRTPGNLRIDGIVVSTILYVISL